MVCLLAQVQAGGWAGCPSVCGTNFICAVPAAPGLSLGGGGHLAASRLGWQRLLPCQRLRRTFPGGSFPGGIQPRSWVSSVGAVS